MGPAFTDKDCRQLGATDSCEEHGRKFVECAKLRLDQLKAAQLENLDLLEVIDSLRHFIGDTFYANGDRPLPNSWYKGTNKVYGDVLSGIMSRVPGQGATPAFQRSYRGFCEWIAHLAQNIHDLRNHSGSSPLCHQDPCQKAWLLVDGARKCWGHDLDEIHSRLNTKIVIGDRVASITGYVVRPDNFVMYELSSTENGVVRTGRITDGALRDLERDHKAPCVNWQGCG